MAKVGNLLVTKFTHRQMLNPFHFSFSTAALPLKSTNARGNVVGICFGSILAQYRVVTRVTQRVTTVKHVCNKQNYDLGTISVHTHYNVAAVLDWTKVTLGSCTFVSHRIWRI
jgi:hypothetical protein